METIPSHLGIDVGKAHLDVCLEGGSPFRVPNTEDGFLEICRRFPLKGIVHLEASGGYERLVKRYLSSKGWKVEVHDPLRAKRLSQALSSRAKTDALDARRLASLGRQLPSQAERSAEEEELRELSRAVETLKTTAAEYKRRAAAPALSEIVRKAFVDAAKALEEQTLALEGEFAKRAKGTSVGERVELAKSVPGVGPVLARVAACELPLDLSTAEPGKISSYVGLAPMDNSSGERTGRKRIAEGCAWLKKILYLAALSCVRHQSWATGLYRRLRDKGKAHRQAIVAVMRRLLLRILAVLKRGSPWKEEPPKA